MTVYTIKRRDTSEYYGGKAYIMRNAAVHIWSGNIGQAFKWRSREKAEKRAAGFMVEAEVVALEI